MRPQQHPHGHITHTHTTGRPRGGHARLPTLVVVECCAVLVGLKPKFSDEAAQHRPPHPCLFPSSNQSMTTTPTTSPTTSLHRLLQGFHVPLSVLAPPPAQPTHPHQRGSLASSSPTMDPALLLRLDFLWQQALTHLPTNPTYSRTLSRQLIRIRDVALAHAALHPRLPELLCVDCGVILVPGLTARARLHPRRKSCPINTTRRRHRHNKKHEHATSGGGGSILPPVLKNEVTYACLLCQGVNKADGVPRRTGGAATATTKEASIEIKAQSSFIVPPPPIPPQQQRERQPPAAPAEEEEFIPLHPQGGQKRPYQHEGQPQAPRLLLDAKPRKRKAQEEKKKQQQQQPKPESRSLGQLRGFLSSLKKP